MRFANDKLNPNCEKSEREWIVKMTTVRQPQPVRGRQVSTKGLDQIWKFNFIIFVLHVLNDMAHHSQKKDMAHNSHHGNAITVSFLNGKFLLLTHPKEPQIIGWKACSLMKKINPHAP